VMCGMIGGAVADVGGFGEVLPLLRGIVVVGIQLSWVEGVFWLSLSWSMNRRGGCGKAGFGLVFWVSGKEGVTKALR
jgi:hypothetical protein